MVVSILTKITPKLYIFNGSPPARATLMLAKHIGLNLEIKTLEITKKEHLTSEYMKLNPTHTVPTFVDDDGFVLWESHAILAYIVQKYSKDASLYPKDLKQRAIVDQRLNFDNGIAFTHLANIVRPLLFRKKNMLNENDKINVVEVYGFVETFLGTTQWIAGDNPTIADYSVVATITTLNKLIPVDVEKYTKLTKWLKSCNNLPGFEAGNEGLKNFEKVITNILAQK